MSDLTKKHRRRIAAKLLTGTVVVVLCVPLLVMVSVRIYLSSELPAPQLSRFATSYLHQNFTVKSVEASGDTLLLRGVRLENPAGFPGEALRRRILLPSRRSGESFCSASSASVSSPCKESG